MEALGFMLPLHSEWSKWKENASLPAPPTDQNVLLFVSDKESLPVTLMFQGAVTLSTEGKFVVFIRQKHFTQMPQQVHGMPQPDPTSMKLMKIMYLTTEEELTNYLYEIHCQPTIPDAIFIENLHLYLTANQTDLIAQRQARLCSVLVDTANYLVEKRGTHCQIAASLELAKHIQLPVLHRFLKNIYQISGTCDQGSGSDIQEIKKLEKHDNLLQKDQYKSYYSIQIDCSGSQVKLKGLLVLVDNS